MNVTVAEPRFTVLQCFTPGIFGGAESVVSSLARGLVGRGHSVHVAATLALNDREPDVVRRMQQAGVDVHVLRIPARRYDNERRELVRLSEACAAELIHTHGYRADLVGLLAARALGLPVVSTVHGFTGGGWKNRVYERMQRRAYAHFDAVVAVSKPLADQLGRKAGVASRLHTIPNAWSPDGPALSRGEARRALELPPEGLVVGWVGRISREKGCDLFLEAARQLEDLDVTFSIIGDGPERLELQRRFEHLATGGRIRWHGPQPEAGSLMEAYDLLVLSSRSEGTPIVLLEAMHAAVPVVATEVGGVPDVVSRNEAWLVGSLEPDAIASAIRAALMDEQTRMARCRAARERLPDEFDPTRWVARYEAVYGQIANRSRPVASLR